MAITGNGEKAVVKEGGQDMAENLGTSAQSANKPTRRTSVLTREQALEILQQSLLECRKAGIELQIAPKLYVNGGQAVGILLANVDYIAGNFALINGKEGE